MYWNILLKGYRRLKKAKLIVNIQDNMPCIYALPCQLTTFHSLTHWGRVTHICVVKLTIIGSDNGLSPGRRQAIIWTNAGILLIGPLGTNFSEIVFGIKTSSFKKMHLKMSSAKWRPFCLGLNVLKQSSNITTNASHKKYSESGK